MKLQDCVPSHKHDLAAVEKAAMAGYPALNDILGDLLEWIQDPNWPVAEPLTLLMAKAGAELAPHLMVVFASQDEEWKQAILTTLAPKLQPAVRTLLKPELERMANSPTEAEAAATVDEAARIVLVNWNS